MENGLSYFSPIFYRYAMHIYNRINPGIPIILLTGYGKEIGDKTSLSNYGISMLLNKPVRIGELKSAINELISGRTT